MKMCRWRENKGRLQKHKYQEQKQKGRPTYTRTTNLEQVNLREHNTMNTTQWDLTIQLNA